MLNVLYNMFTCIWMCQCANVLQLYIFVQVWKKVVHTDLIRSCVKGFIIEIFCVFRVRATTASRPKDCIEIMLFIRVRTTTASRPKDPFEITLFIIILRKRSHFWGLYHARKHLKICKRIWTAKKFHILGASHINVTKWLYSSPWRKFPIFNIGLEEHVQTYKKASGTHSVNPTGSRPFWIQCAFLAIRTHRTLTNSS